MSIPGGAILPGTLNPRVKKRYKWYIRRKHSRVTRHLPLYRRIYQHLLSDIQSGKYPPGAKLPTEKELAKAYGVSRITSKRALTMLAEEGLVDRIRGRGSFVHRDAAARVASSFADADCAGSPAAVSDVSEVCETPGDERPAWQGQSMTNPGKGGGANPQMSGSSRLIGFIAQDLGFAYGTELLAGVERESHRLGFSLLFRLSGGSQESEIAAIEEMMAHDPVGLIVFPVNGERYNPALLKLYLAGFPVVLVDRYFRGLHIASVGSDNEAAAREAVSYLIDLGHRSIALLSPPPEGTVTIEDRIKGYVAAFTDHHLAIDHALFLTDLTTALPGTPQESAYERDRRKIARLLADHPEVSACFALEYPLAQAAQSVVQAAGKSVPEDLSILCFDAPAGPAGDGSGHFFTHVRQDERGMGRQAVRLLVDLIEGRGDRSQDSLYRRVLPTQLIRGRSTAAKPLSQTSAVG